MKNSKPLYYHLLPSILVLFVLSLDQYLKFWVKMNMFIGSSSEIVVFKNWFILHFTENNGMAFGIGLGGELGKYLLTLFRILAVGAITWYIISLKRKNASFGFIMVLSLILAGAIGNILDSTFYGVIFSQSTPFNKSLLMPETGGYSAWFQGKVVDMLYFPLIETYWPHWVPVIGGNSFVFFRPVFNLADSAISIGVFSILLFYRKHF